MEEASNWRYQQTQAPPPPATAAAAVDVTKVPICHSWRRPCPFKT